MGKTMTMHFYCGGITSECELFIVEEDEKFIHLCEDEDGCDTIWKFNKSTGECVNDNTFLGARRYIDSIKTKEDDVLLKLIRYRNDTFENEEVLYNVNDDKIIKKGDYISDYIDGFIHGLEYANVKFSITEKVVYLKDELFETLKFFNNI